jgi:hypothetical protein
MGLLGQAEGEASGITSPRSEALFFAALGPRVGLTVPLPAGLFARATADALFPLTPFSLGINGQTVWSSSAVMGLLQGGVGWRFP